VETLQPLQRLRSRCPPIGLHVAVRGLVVDCKVSNWEEGLRRRWWHLGEGSLPSCWRLCKPPP